MNDVRVMIPIFLICFFGAIIQPCCQVNADLAFVANLDGNWELCVSDDDGNGLRRLTETPFDEKEPQWSADKKQIVYATSDGRLNLINPSSGFQRTVESVLIDRPRLMPSFSPNGQYLAFVQFRPPEEKDDTDLMILGLKTGKVRKLLDQPSLQMWPSFSPSGDKLAYTTLHCNDSCGRMIQEIWIAAADGTWARQLLLTHSFCQQPRWAPDGQKIAFVADKQGNPDIWVVDLLTWQIKQVTSYTGLDLGPAWSPDGLRIAFISTRSGTREVWIKNLTSGNLEKLCPFGKRKIPCKDVAW